MDKSALKLLEQKFHSISDAQLVLCQMIRSYVPNMSATMFRTRKMSFGSTTTFLCSAYSKKKNPKTSDKEGGESQTCSWKATLTWNSEENFYFFLVKYRHLASIVRIASSIIRDSRRPKLISKKNILL